METGNTALVTNQKYGQSWGETSGFWFQYREHEPDASSISVRTAVFFDSPEKKEALNAHLDDLKKNKTIIGYNFEDGSYRFVLKAPSFRNKKHEEFIQNIVEYFKQNGIQAACQECNRAVAGNFFYVDDTTVKLCPDCQQVVQDVMNERSDSHELAPNNYLKGFIGAAIGALLGGVLWVLVASIGYIAAICGLAITFFAVKGYILMKGKQTKFAGLIIILICLLTVFAANLISLDIELYQVFVEEGYEVSFFSDIVPLTFEVAFDPDIIVDFMGTLAIGLIFLVASGFRVMKSFFKSASYPAGRFERV